MSGDDPLPRADSEAFAADFFTLCEWGAELETSDIPDPVLKRAALVFMDDVAAIIAARHEPELIAFNKLLAPRSGRAESSLLNATGTRFDRNSAALANGLAAGWCELDEGYRRTPCHAGLYIMPALLAEGEATGATLGEMLRALVAAYEITTRIARSFRYETPRAHPHAALAAIGAASGVALLRRLDATGLLAAIAAASTVVSPGPYSHAVKGALVRNAWSGHGAWSGLMAADWATCGITGLATSPYEVFVDVFGARHFGGELVDQLGTAWGLSDGYHKLHACCQYSHSAVDAAISIAPQLAGQRDHIARIVVATHPLGLTLNNRAPETTLAAKFSLPHIIAATLRYGHAGADAFTSADLSAGDVASLRQRVELVPYDNIGAWPNDRPARVEVHLANGTVLDATCLSAQGGPDSPYPLDVLLAKIENILAAPYPGLAAKLRGITAADSALLAQLWGDLIG